MCCAFITLLISYFPHLANLIFYTRNGLRRCLVCEWVDAVTDVYSLYFDLPVITAGQTRLAQEYVAREARDACHASNLVSNINKETYFS